MSTISTYAISLTVENSLSVLQRVASIFTRNRLNIEQLNVLSLDRAGKSKGGSRLSMVHIILFTNQQLADRLVKQLRRIVEILEVDIDRRMKFDESEES